MSTRLRRQDTAAALGAAGTTLGVAAGVIQASVGARIPAWTGAKATPLGLGLLTILLSLIALMSAAILRRAESLTPGRRAGAAIGLLVPAGLCLSTAGRLWYLPGVVLLTAVGCTVAAGEVRELAAVIRANWLSGLVSVLGAVELLMAVAARPATIMLPASSAASPSSRRRGWRPDPAPAHSRYSWSAPCPSPCSPGGAWPRPCWPSSPSRSARPPSDPTPRP